MPFVVAFCNHGPCFHPKPFAQPDHNGGSQSQRKIQQRNGPDIIVADDER